MRYTEQLSNIRGLRVIPSQANYIMTEIINGITAKELNRRLIIKYNILIKDLVTKIHQDGRQYVRLAIKTKHEDDELIMALKKELV